MPDLATAPPSPFLPDTQVMFAWDSTSLGYFKTCPRLYQYIMIEGYGSSDDSVHLRFGIELHQALEDYDKSCAAGIPHDDAVFDTIRELLIRTWGWAPDPDTRAGKYKNRHSLVRTVVWYLEHYKNDPAKTYIRPSGQPAVELSFQFNLDFGPVEGQPYVLCGHLDRVVEFNDDLFVMDRKSTLSSLGDYYFDQFEPHNQMTIYTWASRVLLMSPIKGVIIDGIQVLVDSNKFQRGFTYRTEEQLQEWMYDLKMLLTLAKVYAEMGYWPMNDTSCDKFGGCPFRKVCAKSPHVREIYLKDYVRLAPEDRWNPIKPRS